MESPRHDASCQMRPHDHGMPQLIGCIPNFWGTCPCDRGPLARSRFRLPRLLKNCSNRCQMQVACRQNRTAVRLILVNEDAACAAAVNCLQPTDCLNHSSDNCCESCPSKQLRNAPPFRDAPWNSQQLQTPRFCSTLVRKTNERSRGPAATAYRFQMNARPFCPSCPLRAGATRSKLLPSLPSAGAATARCPPYPKKPFWDEE